MAYCAIQLSAIFLFLVFNVKREKERKSVHNINFSSAHFLTHGYNCGTMKPLQIQFQTKQSVATFKEMMSIVYTHLYFLNIFFSPWTRDVIQIFLALITRFFCVVVVVVFVFTCLFSIFIGYAYMRWVILVLAVNARCAVKWIAEQKNDWTDARARAYICLCFAIDSSSFFIQISYSSCCFFYVFFFFFSFGTSDLARIPFSFLIKVPNPNAISTIVLEKLWKLHQNPSDWSLVKYQPEFSCCAWFK